MKMDIIYNFYDCWEDFRKHFEKDRDPGVYFPLVQEWGEKTEA